MKRFIFALLALFTIVNISTAQDEGYIKMEITDIATDNAEAAPFIDMMKGTQTEYFFNKEKSLVKANMMGGMMEMTTIVNNSDEQMTMYMNAMGTKMQIESTKEEREKGMSAGENEIPKFNIAYDENVTKTILGYECTKAIVTFDDDPDANEIILYVAKDLKASNKMIQGLDKIELDGFPLEYVMDSQGMQLTVTTVELKDEVDTSVFEFNSRGYQKMTWEEFQNRMAMMGGMGK